jgi:hypothetical protein
MEYEKPECLERESATYRSDLLDKGVTEQTEDYMCLIYGKEIKIIHLGQDFFYIRISYHQLSD